MMKSLLSWIFILLAFLTTSIVCHANEPIKIAAEEWPPFSSEHLKYNGLMSRIITEAFALEGLNVEIGFFPSARALLYVKEGLWDGIGGWTANEERAVDHHFSDPLFSESIVFFHLKRNPFDWNEMSDLKDIRIGATNEYYYGEAFEKAEKEGTIQIERVPSDELNLRKILKNRIEICPMNLDAGLSLLQTKFKQEEIDSITYHPRPVDEGPLVLMFSKKVEKNKEIVEVFNRGLKRLKDSGRYAQFFEESRQGKYLKLKGGQK